MKSRLRVMFFAMLLLSLMLISATATIHAQDTTFCPNGTTTTLQQSGVPNLFRLGLQRGVPWQVIMAASGITDERRVLPNQLLCVPNNVTSVSISTTTTATIYYTTASDTDTDSMVDQPQPTQNFITPGGYCDALLPGGIPIDRGSCLLELQSIQSGVQSIVQTGITCNPRAVTVDEQGNLRQCSVRGDRLLSLPPPPAVP